MAYPLTIDTMSQVISTQTLAQAGHTARHNEVATVVNAIQAELGINPSGNESGQPQSSSGAATVAERFSTIDSRIALKADIASPAFTGVVSVPVGTAAAPSIAFTGNLTSGIYLTGTTQLGFSISGTQRATVDSSGLGVTGTVVASSTIAASGLAGSLLSSTTPSALGTAGSGSSAIPARADHVHSNSGVTLVSPIITGTANVTGALDVQEIRETVVDGTITTGTLTVDYTAGTIVYISTAPTANFTINLTNAPVDNGKIITITAMVTQGTTGYIPNVFQIGGASQTIRWQYGVTPTPTSSAGKIDIFSFTLIRRSGAWTVLGNININF